MESSEESLEDVAWETVKASFVVVAGETAMGFQISSDFDFAEYSDWNCLFEVVGFAEVAVVVAVDGESFEFVAEYFATADLELAADFVSDADTLELELGCSCDYLATNSATFVGAVEYFEHSADVVA